MQIKKFIFGGIIVGIESEYPFSVGKRYNEFLIEDGEVDYRIHIIRQKLPQISCDGVTYYPGYCSWEENQSICRMRFINTADGKKEFYSYTKENSTEALQLYSQNVLKYLDTRLIFEGFDFINLLNRKKAILLHASYIIYQKQGILFTAPSGVGKSTQASLWEKYKKAQIINGDRALIRRTNGIISVHGISYSGTSGICYNQSAPLSAIVCLSQNDENHIKKLNGIEALKMVLPQCSFHKDNKEEFERFSATLSDVLSNVPVYFLMCTPDERAVSELERML